MDYPSPHLMPRRYSYAVLLAAVAVGLLMPRLANWLLGPALLLGMLLLGVAHGACDQYVVPATHPLLARERARYWAGFLGGYLGLAGVVLVLWWRWPALALAVFFGLTAWHWGSADAPVGGPHRSQWLAHSLLRGSFLFLVPLWCWPTETQAVVNGLLALAGAAPVSAAGYALALTWLAPTVLGGHLLLWGSYLMQGRGTVAATDALEVALLTALLVVLPPVLSAGVYFVFWHSLQHVQRMSELMSGANGEAVTGRRILADVGFFLRRSVPLLLISLLALAVLYGLAWTRAASPSVLLSLALLVASVVTLPHALLVTLGMDAARWRR